MPPLIKNMGLYADLYELTMLQGYYLSGRKDIPASFDYFFRANPFEGGYVLFAGLSDLLEILKNYRFSKQECDYLASLGFRKEFLDYLGNFHFTGDVYAFREGDVVFPNEPVVRVDGTLTETQIIETVLLNILNFESLIATKASRMRKAAGNALLTDFGLRRAQGLGGIHASKASIMGGFDSTSNTFSAFGYGLKPSGTMAHSWIQSYDDEIEAFREYANIYPDSCILLVDTYDTLKTGIPNAIQVAKEMEDKGHALKAIRLDSGDLAYLSKKARELLDAQGLDYVKIVASSQLDEYIIRSLNEQGARIDAYGVGTKLVTGKEDAALDGVYKISWCNGSPRIKISDTLEKMTLPGRKKVRRYLDSNGKFLLDGIYLENESMPARYFHPHQPEKNTDTKGMQHEALMQQVMVRGEVVMEDRSISERASFARERLTKLPGEHKRFENPHVYRTGISEELMNLRDRQKIRINEKMKK